MSQFEVTMAMVSLIMALGLAQGLRGLSEILVSQKCYSPHTLWVIAYVLMILLGWWSFWDFNVVRQWKLSTYLVVLAAPAILYTGIHLRTPSTRDSDIDWRAQFFRVRRLFFGLGVAMVVVAVFANVQYFGTPFVHPYRLSHAVYITIFSVGFLLENENVQRSLPIFFIASNAASLLLVRMNIGALVSGQASATGRSETLAWNLT